MKCTPIYKIYSHIWSARLYIRCKAMYKMHAYVYMWDCLRCTPIYKITLNVRVCEGYTPIYKVHAYVRYTPM
jgi:hypothetical protein